MVCLNTRQLGTACLLTNPQMVDALLKTGAVVNAVQSPLHLACSRVRLGEQQAALVIIDRLLRACADVNNTKDHSTALQSACRYGGTSVASVLLDAGADPDLVGGDDRRLCWLLQKNLSRGIG